MDMAGETGNGPERAALYQALAEALAPDGPPEWMAEEGRNWPLYNVVASLVRESPTARQAVVALEGVPSRPLERLKDSVFALFTGSFRPYCDLYESTWVSGRPMGPETFQVERLYRAAGLEVDGAELADHAAYELAFLGYLASMGESELERSFIRKHAGRWLPSLGRRLTLSGDLVYGTLGALLVGWLEEALRRPVDTFTKVERSILRPSIPNPEACSLCGFCVQACPSRSLQIVESDTETKLYLYHDTCQGCGRCRKACEFGALLLEPRQNVTCLYGDNRILLRSSFRASCAICDSPLISEAEMAFVRQELGNPYWLECCQDCRPTAML
jgi:TorA maturation chaperone TorD/Pyruvate/2-oxoacid:ferredoxin oxidoreductase delta subunit